MREKRAAKLEHERFSQLDSSAHAEALQVKEFHVAPIFAAPLAVSKQLDEVEGRAKEYPTALYEQLIKTVVPLR
jgi:hypothetical protein